MHPYGWGRVFLFWGVVWTCISLSPLSGQEITGNISGSVSDPSGAIIPAAKVTASSVRTGASRTTETTNQGIFFFNSLPIGEYTLDVEAPGFKKSKTTGIQLNVNDKLNFPIVLEIGGVAESVTVVAEGGQLQTESAEVSNLIGTKQVQELPLNGRSYSQLVELAPGVTPESGRVGGGTGINSDTGVSINGNQTNSNLWLIDGQNNMDIGSNAGNVVTPSVDSIEEFKVLRNNFSAEFGMVTGGVVNVVTKAGSQAFHGSAYEFLRNDKLDATDFFLNSSGAEKSKLRYNDFGYTVGGPFWIPGKYNRDRTKDFFFVSQEWRREVRGEVATDNVPTLRQRQGILDPGCAVTAGPCIAQGFDPQEVPLGEENVPAAEIDPNSTAILDRYPLPNASYVDNGFNWIASQNKGTQDRQDMVRWDHNFGEKALLMIRYLGEDQGLDGINSQLWGDDNFPSVNSDWTFGAHNSVIKLTSTLSPRLVNDFQFGYTNNRIVFATGKSSDPTLASRAGFTYTELFPQTSGSFPTMGGVESFGSIQHTAPFFNREDLFQFKDDIAYTFGSHNLKMGFFGGRSHKREPANGGEDDTAGSVEFDSFQDLLFGNLTTYQEAQTLNEVPDRWRDVAVYVQDTWKLRPGFTLDIGLRWQFLGQVFSAHDNIANFYPNLYDPSRCSSGALNEDGLVDPTACDVLNGIVTPSSPNAPNRALVQNHYGDWEPRLGFAWDVLPNHKLIVRAGGGVFHGRDAISQTSALGLPPPNNRTASLNNVSFSRLVSGDLSPFNPETPQAPVLLQVLDPVYFNPQSYQYSSGIQYALNPDTVLEINYVGSHQIHQGRNRDINQIAPQYQPEVYDGTLNPDVVRPYLGYSQIYVNERAATTRYNSLQVYVNRRLAQGLQFQAAYTFSRLISNTINRDSEGRSSPVQDAFHPELEKSLANQDQTHALTLNYTYELPFFKDTDGLKGSLLGGWEVVGITTFRSGLPQTVCLDHDVAGTRGEECQRPDLVAAANLDSGDRTLRRYFNTDAFVLQQPGTFGNAARNVVRGPGINNWDFSIFKSFDMPWLGKRSALTSETAKVQFRAEFFNLWNHTQFSDLDTTFVPAEDTAGSPVDSGSSFGTITGARAPREIQFGLKVIW